MATITEFSLSSISSCNNRNDLMFSHWNANIVIGGNDIHRRELVGEIAKELRGNCSQAYVISNSPSANVSYKGLVESSNIFNTLDKKDPADSYMEARGLHFPYYDPVEWKALRTNPRVLLIIDDSSTDLELLTRLKIDDFIEHGYYYNMDVVVSVQHLPLDRYFKRYYNVFRHVFIFQEDTAVGRRTIHQTFCSPRTDFFEVFDRFNAHMNQIKNDRTCLVVDASSSCYDHRKTKCFYYQLKPSNFEAAQRAFIELVSVPAGRFKGLLPDGGVEYQRQLEQFGELATSHLN